MSIKLCSNDQVYKKEPTTVGITSGFNYQISKKEPKKVGINSGFNYQKNKNKKECAVIDSKCVYKRDKKSNKPGSNHQVIKKDSTDVDTKPGFNYQEIKGGDGAGDVVGEQKAGDDGGEINSKVELHDEFGCKICGEINPTKISHMKHLTKNHSQGAIDIASKIVKKNVKRGDPKTLFTCEYCNQSFSFKETLKGHLDSVHKEETLILCDVCGNNYNNKEDFKCHILDEHKDKSEYSIVLEIIEELLESALKSGKLNENDTENLPVKHAEVIRGGGPTQKEHGLSYTTTVYPETEDNNLKLGLTIKGTSEKFKAAHAKIALLLSTNEEDIEINKFTLRVVEKPFERGCVKAVVQLKSDNSETGKAVLKVWNISKKGGTIQITRFKGESFNIVESLAKDIINVLLEDSQTETNKFFKSILIYASKQEEKTVKRLETPKQLAGDHIKNRCKAFKCDQCNVERASKKTLNNHKEKKHKGIIVKSSALRFNCEHCDLEQESNRKLRNHQLEYHIGALPGFNQLAGSKRSKNENNMDDL